MLPAATTPELLRWMSDGTRFQTVLLHRALDPASHATIVSPADTRTNSRPDG
jgi:hypothetical protein